MDSYAANKKLEDTKTRFASTLPQRPYRWESQEHRGLMRFVHRSHGKRTQTGLATDLRMGMMNYLDLVQDFNTDNQDARKMIDAARAKNTSNAAPAPKL